MKGSIPPFTIPEKALRQSYARIERDMKRMAKSMRRIEKQRRGTR
jgi:hypothetical protein